MHSLHPIKAGWLRFFIAGFLGSLLVGTVSAAAWTNTPVTGYYTDNLHFALGRSGTFFIGSVSTTVPAGDTSTVGAVTIAQRNQTTGAYTFSFLGPYASGAVSINAMRMALGLAPNGNPCVAFVRPGGSAIGVYYNTGAMDTGWALRLPEWSRGDSSTPVAQKVVVNAAGGIYLAYEQRAGVTTNTLTVVQRQYNPSTQTMVWSSLGSWTVPSVTAANGHFDFRLDENGTPTIAYIEVVGAGWQIRSGQWNGTSWSMWPAVAADATKGVSVVVRNSVPWIAFGNPADASRPAVRTLQNNVWVNPSSNSIADSAQDFLDLAVGGDNRPVVAYANNATQIYVKRLAQSWVEVGASSYPTDSAYAGALALALDEEDDPYVAYIDSMDHPADQPAVGLVNVMRYKPDADIAATDVEATAEDSVTLEASVTTRVTGAQVQFWLGTTATNMQLIGTQALDSVGRRQLVFHPTTVVFGANYFWQVKVLDSTGLTELAQTDTLSFTPGPLAWQDVGPQPVTKSVASPGSGYALGLSSAGTPYVAYSDANQGAKIVVKTYTGTAWIPVGQPFSGESYNGVSLVVTDSTLYVANSEYNNGSKLAVYSYDRGNPSAQWQPLPTAGLTRGAVKSYTPMAIDHQGVLYVACLDGAAGGQASVFRFNPGATEWTTVGTPGFTSGQVDTLCLQISPAGTPHLAYRAEANYVKVRAFNGQSWPELTNNAWLNFYGYGGGYGLMDIAADGQIYLLAQGAVAPFLAQVYRSAGNQQWDAVGAQFGHSASNDRAHIFIAPNGWLYEVMVNKPSGNYMIGVSRLDVATGQWVPVGDPINTGRSAAGAIQQLFTPGKLPVLSYRNLSKNSTYQVQVKQAVPSTTP